MKFLQIVESGIGTAVETAMDAASGTLSHRTRPVNRSSCRLASVVPSGTSSVALPASGPTPPARPPAPSSSPRSPAVRRTPLGRERSAGGTEGRRRWRRWAGAPGVARRRCSGRRFRSRCRSRLHCAPRPGPAKAHIGRRGCRAVSVGNTRPSCGRPRNECELRDGQTLVWISDPWYTLIVGTDIQAPGP